MSGMGSVVVISGKGGVGKTKLAGLLIRCLSKFGSILAIDSDPDSNLPQTLGIEVNKTVGGIRETILNPPPAKEKGSDKEASLRKALLDITYENDLCDLIVMGRSEGPGCYCAVNNIIQEVIDYKANSYDLVIVDCEPGLEHLSRRTTKDVDLMIAITDMSKNGILCVERIHELTQELYTDIREFMCVANKVNLDQKDYFEKVLKERNLHVEAWVPFDKKLEEFDLVGESILELQQDSPALQAVEKLAQKIYSLTVGHTPIG